MSYFLRIATKRNVRVRVADIQIFKGSNNLRTILRVARTIKSIDNYPHSSNDLSLVKKRKQTRTCSLRK